MTGFMIKTIELLLFVHFSIYILHHASLPIALQEENFKVLIGYCMFD